MSQAELARVTGVPASKVSRYVSHSLEPSERVFDLLLCGLGVRVEMQVVPVAMERTKRRSWLLHHAVSSKVGASGIDEAGWARMQHNLDRVRSNTQGPIHGRNLDHWQRLIDSRDVRELHRVLVDTSAEGIGMREVSPMTGFLTEEERVTVLDDVRRIVDAVAETERTGRPGAGPIRLTLDEVSTPTELAAWIRDELMAPVPDVGHMVRVLIRETDRWRALGPTDLAAVLADGETGVGTARWDALLEALTARIAHLCGYPTPTWARRTRLEDAWYPWENTVTDPRWQVIAVTQTPAEMLHRGIILPGKGLRVV